MLSERLIGLEAALAELGRLYVVAKGFVALRPAAETLLPQLSSMAAELRRHLRRQSLDDAVIDAVAQRVAGLRQEWRERLERLRESALYQRCVAAWDAERAEELAGLLPQLISDIEPAAELRSLFYGVSPASGRRRPGTRPFLTPEACADKIAAYDRDGIPVDTSGADWWSQQLGSLVVEQDPSDLDTPIALRLDPASIQMPMFQMAGQPSVRIFAKVVRARFSVILEHEVTDEWWQAFDESYEQWRAALVQELQRRGISAGVSV